MEQLVVRLPVRHEDMGSNPGWSVTFFIVENIPGLSGRLVQTQNAVNEFLTDTRLDNGHMGNGSRDFDRAGL